MSSNYLFSYWKCYLYVFNSSLYQQISRAGQENPKIYFVRQCTHWILEISLSNRKNSAGYQGII